MTLAVTALLAKLVALGCLLLNKVLFRRSRFLVFEYRLFLLLFTNLGFWPLGY